MKCSLSLDINKRENKRVDNLVNKYGAINVTAAATVTVDPLFNPSVKLPKSNMGVEQKLKTVKPIYRAQSYKFSGINFNKKVYDSLAIGLTASEHNSISRAGGQLPLEHAEDFFRRKNALISPTRSNENRVIFTGNTQDVKNTSTRTFVRVTRDDKRRIYNKIAKQADKVTDKQINKEYSLALQGLVVSALYRGFDVVFDGPANADVIQKALRRFNSHLNPTGSKVIYATDQDTAHDAVHVNDFDMFLTDLSRETIPFRKPNVFNSIDLLNNFLTAKEREVLDRHKRANNKSKRYIVDKLGQAFARYMPNVSTVAMTSFEIDQAYGPEFSNKKGFLIGNDIVLNIDQMDASTAFHEFGHYYMSWLKEYNRTVYDRFLSLVANNYQEEFQDYKKIYNANGIAFNTEEILEEIFVDELGMSAAKELGKVLSAEQIKANELDEYSAGLSVDMFMDKFMKALVRRNDIKRSDVGFDINTTIGSLFNIANAFDTREGGLFEDIDRDAIESMKSFFIERYSPEDVFEGLIGRGLIRKVGSNRIQLLDASGNVVDENGALAPIGTKFKYSKVVSARTLRAKEKLIDHISGYLRKYQNLAHVRFADNTNPTSTVDLIMGNTDALRLDEDKNVYVDTEGNEMRRTTEYLQTEFTDNAATSTYVDVALFSDAQKRYKANRPDSEDETLKTKNSIKFAQKFMTEQGREYKRLKKEKEEIFEFKTAEGTYLHNISELFIRSLNYSNTIDYDTKREGGYKHYMTAILDNLTNVDRDQFAQYYEDNFFSRLKNQHGTKEFEAFKESFEFVKEHMDTESTPHARDLLQLLRKTLDEHVFGALKGPLTLLPEVKLKSKSLGVAGTLDLVVVDGDGVAHIFDYKTKETGKRRWWDYSTPVRLKDELKAYSNNAMMKASIQTSVYKLILMEMGIKTGPANVFYVESEVRGDADTAFSEKTQMRYAPKAILKKPLIDVTAELVTHFGKDKVLPEVFQASNDATDIMEFIQEVSGGTNIDRTVNLDKAAETIYNRAISRQHNTTDPNLLQAYKALGITSPKSGLVVRLFGNAKFNIDPSITKYEDIIEEIKRLIVERHDVKSVESKLESQFYDPTTRGNTKQDQIISGLLAGTSAGTHEFTKISSRLNLGVDFSGFTMVRDKITNEHRLIILNHDSHRNIPFGKDHHNIFGNYITNNIAKAKFPTLNWSNTNYNMRMVKAGLMMARMRQLDPDFKVSLVVSNDDFREGLVTPRLEDINTIMYVTKAMIELAVEADPASVPDTIKRMLNDDKLFEGKTYVPNPIDALGEFLSMSIQDVHSIYDIFKGESTGIKRAELLKGAIENLDARQDYEELYSRLHDFRRSLELGRLHTVEARIADPVWTLTDQVIMFINNFNHTVSPSNTTFVQNFLMTTSKVANTYSAAFNRRTFNSSVNIREDFMRYKNEHNELIQKLADARGINIGLLGPALIKTSMKKIFSNLYKTDNTDRQTAFILKSPNDGTLLKEERDYLRYVKKTLQEFGELSSFQQVVVPDGWIPLMPKSRAGQTQDMSAMDQAREQVRLYNTNANFHDSKEDTIDSAFSVENRFKSQLPNKLSTAEDNFTDSRRKILGIDDAGELLPSAVDKPLSKIEDNIENILDTFVTAALDAHHYRDVTSFGRALFYNVKRAENLSGLAYNQLIETLTLIQKRVINHQESDKNNKAIKLLNKFTTNAAIAGTVNQFLLEAFTNPMVTSANYLTDKLYGAMFKGTREFSLASYARATSIVTNPNHKDHQLVIELDKLYGITSSDTRSLKEMLNKLEKHSIWQTKKLMYLNKEMMELWQKITFTAYMIEQGSFNAHSLDVNGDLVYDESKDKRFFDPTATIEEQADKRKKYNAVKEELSKQRNGLTGTNDMDYDDRKLKKAWTTYDSNYIKELVVELYSSMDESSKSLAMYYTHMSFLSKMRSWIFAKIPRYFQKPMTAEENQSASRLTRVEDPDAEDGYRYEYKGVATEGILYTVQSMARQLAEYKLEVFKKGSLDEHQKKNLSKLMADLFVFSVMSAGAAGVFAMVFDDDDEKSELAKLVYQRWMMATGDVFLLKSLMDMTTGNSSMFISVSVGARLLNSVLNASVISAQALYDEDVTIDDALSATNNVLRNSAGIYRTLELGYDTARELQE